MNVYVLRFYLLPISARLCVCIFVGALRETNRIVCVSDRNSIIFWEWDFSFGKALNDFSAILWSKVITVMVLDMHSFIYRAFVSEIILWMGCLY